MKHFRAAQPLSDDDFAAIRRTVLATVATREKRRPWLFVMRFAFAMAMIAVMTVMWPRHRDEVTPIVTTQHVVIPAETIVAEQRRPEAAGPAGRRPAFHGPALRVAHRKHREVQRLAMRVELQTADPEVRIIWITN